MAQRMYKPTVGKPTPPGGPPIKTGLAGAAPLTGGMPSVPTPRIPKAPGLPKAPMKKAIGPGFSNPGTGRLDNEAVKTRTNPINKPPIPAPPKLRVPAGKKGGGPVGFGPTGV